MMSVGAALKSGEVQPGMSWRGREMQQGGQVLFYLLQTQLLNIKQGLTKDVCGIFVEGEQVEIFLCLCSLTL